MMLTKERVLQTIKNAKSTLGIEDMEFEVRFAKAESKIGKRAEIFIWSRKSAEIVLYPEATFFSVRHELCHAKLFRMGVPLTKTEMDLELFPIQENYTRMVVIVEYYINELQRRFFEEYYAVDEAGTPQLPPFSGLPELPQEEFTAEQVNSLIEIAKERRS